MPNVDVSAYRNGLLAGTWTPDDSRRMLSLSADPAALIEAIKRANQEPEVAAALAEMMARHGMGDAQNPDDGNDGAVDIQHGLAEVGEVLNAAVQMIAALPGDALSPGVKAAIAKASDLLTQAAAAIEGAEESVAGEGEEEGTDDGADAGGDAESTAPPKNEPKPAPARAARTAAVVAAGARRGK